MTTTNVRRCVLYARLSVTKEESVSIERQLIATRKYAEGRGWDIVGEFVDDGVSATANRPEDRKGWNALLGAADFQAVVIWKVDRLARRVLDFLHVDEILRDRGAGLVAVEDPIDMTTPMGRAFATILAVFGEMEAAAIGSRVSAARAHLVAEGRWTGGGVPYGFMPIDNPNGPGRILVRDPERIGWLTSIVELAQQGASVGNITAWLSSSDAPSPRSSKTSEGATYAWNRQTVNGLLRNPILAGMTPRNPGRRRSGKAADPFSVVLDRDGEPLIDESLAVLTYPEFEALVAFLDARPSPQARPFTERQRTSPFLSRVAHCDKCAVFMCRGTNQQKAVLYCPQCRQTISRSRLDAYLEEKLLTERGDLPHGDATVRDYWKRAWANETAKREVLISQIDTFRIRRGASGGRFDPDRLLIQWLQVPAEAPEGEVAA